VGWQIQSVWVHFVPGDWPPGVGHGYNIISRESAVLVYITDRFYNPQNEGRLGYNHPFLNYDWELQHK
jgi:dTDP-4-dehydrorhamnose 3,5-epimerase